MERELDVGVELAVVADDAGEEASRAPEEEADAERAYLAEKGAAGDFDGAIGGEEGFAGLGEEELTMRREAGATGGALEQGAADFAFEIGDLLADGGLGDVELAAGFAEAAVVGDGAEITEVSQLHNRMLLEFSLSVIPMAGAGNNCETNGHA